MAIKSTAAAYDYVSQIPETVHTILCSAGDYVFSVTSTSLFAFKCNTATNYVSERTVFTAFANAPALIDAVKIGRYYYIAATRSGVSSAVIEIIKFDPIKNTCTTLTTLATDQVRYLKWSPNAKYLAVGRQTNSPRTVVYKFDSALETFTNLAITDALAQTASRLVWSKQSDYLFAYARGVARTSFRAFSVNTSTDVFTALVTNDVISDTFVLNDIEFSPDGNFFVVVSGVTTNGSQFSIYAKTTSTTFTKITLTGTTDFPSLANAPCFVSWESNGAFSAVSLRGQSYTATFNRTTNAVAFVRSLTTLVTNTDIVFTTKFKIPGRNGHAHRGVYISTGVVTFIAHVGLIDAAVPTISVPNLTGTTNRTSAASASPTGSMRYASQSGKFVCIMPASGNFSIKKRDATGAYVDSVLVFNATNNQYPTISPDGRYLVVKNASNTGLALYRYSADIDDFALVNDNWLALSGLSNATNLQFTWSFSGKKLGLWGAFSFWRVIRVDEVNPTFARNFNARAYELKFYGEDFYYKETATSSSTVYVGTYQPATDDYTVASVNVGANNGCAAHTGRFILSWANNGTSDIAMVKTAVATYSSVAGMAAVLGLPGTAMNSNQSFTSPNGRYLVVHDSSNGYRIYDTTTLPFTEVTNGTAIASAAGNATQPFITNDGELIIVGPNSRVRESGDIAYARYPQFGIAMEAVLPIDGQASLTYPKFGITAAIGYITTTTGALNYPKFGVSGNLVAPITATGIANYPVYGAAASVIQTPYEPVVSYDLAFDSMHADISSYVGDLLLTEVPILDAVLTYPTYGIAALAGEDITIDDSAMAYPAFSFAGSVDVPVAAVITNSYPVFGVQSTIIQTEYEPVVSYDLATVVPYVTIDSKSFIGTISAGGPYTYGDIQYPVFGYAGQIISPEEFTVDINYPVFGMEAWAGSPEQLDVVAEYPIFGMAISTARMINGEMIFPVFGVESLVLVEEDISGELVYPIFGTDGDIGANRIHPMELGYPSYSLSAEGEVIPTEYSGELVYPVFGIEAEVEEFIGVRSELIFPTLGMDNSARVAEPAYGELGYPALTMDGYAKIPELGDAAYTFAAFEFSGSIRVPETITGELAYPIFSFEGSVRVPETIVGNYTYPVYGTDGYVRVPETIDIDAQYPVYGFEGNVRVPLVINDSNTYPVFSVAGTIIPSYKGNSEIRYPVFRMDGLSGYPDEINSNLMFPIFGLTGILKEEGETIEVTNAYPVFGVTAELQQFYALNLDSLIGVMSVESEATTIKAARRRLIIRR